ncbi:hypothetical protein Tco_0311939 [Tanacetum coccineum]
MEKIFSRRHLGRDMDTLSLRLCLLGGLRGSFEVGVGAAEEGKVVCLVFQYWTDANLHVHVEEIKVDKTLCFAEEPVEIINRESCYVAISTLVWASKVVSSGFSIVKVRRDSKHGPKFTREREDHMKAKYPRLFVDDDVEPTS